ncbi:ParA family protein [Helicobacter muridarum]|uniref:ParA family protein n=1 Tax=Helicobacter muridarum TaxID=216 RepID=A0A377PXD7_9HELI|nr:ParA family protein [Helicobacter muridarum]TLE01636.1 ParA family protein [Helicobacter muridarum]STQ86253.1 ParA family protein [Helicobacter muridarum]
MSEIICIASQKGGVGKTTTAINLSASLALLDKKVLLIDFDPQSNATVSLGINRRDITESSMLIVMSGRKNIKDIIQKTCVKNLFIAPTDQNLTGVESEFYSQKKIMLPNRIEEIRREYDFIIIDTAPTLGPLTINPLTASNSVIVTVQCEYFALDGMAQLLSTIKALQRTNNPKLQIRGFLPTMYSTQNNLSKEVLDDLTRSVRANFFQDDEGYIVIPRNIRLAESPSHKKPICQYDKKSAGNLAYMRLARAIINKKVQKPILDMESNEQINPLSH